MSIPARAVGAAGSINGTPERIFIGSGSFTIGAAGAITAQDGAKNSGGTVSKTAAKTGRYDLLLVSTFARIQVYASMVGPADAAFGNTNANLLGIRNVSATSATSNAEIQGILASTGADTDFASGTIVEWTAFGYAK